MSSLYSLKKINDIIVEPIKLKPVNPIDIKGFDIIPSLYGNIFVCGRKGVGKTSSVFTIMKNCINKQTKVIIFCNTCYSDKNWIEIINWLEKKKQPHTVFDSIFSNGISNLQILVDSIISTDKEEIKKKSTPIEQPKFSLFDNQESTESSNKKSKKTAPNYLIIFDDISGETRLKKDVEVLLKHVRHYKAKIIISSQYPQDLSPAARVQVDFWELFKGFAKEKIEDVFPQLDLPMEFETFYKIYHSITSENHNFLYINRLQNEIRCNYNTEIIYKVNHE